MPATGTLRNLGARGRISGGMPSVRIHVPSFREDAPSLRSRNARQLGLALLMTSLLAGQGGQPAPRPEPLAQPLKLPRMLASPREILEAMLVRDRAWRRQPGATVEVIGHDEAATLRGMSRRVSGQVRQEFSIMDLLGNQALYALMHQDPAHPTPVLLMPPLAGGPSSSPDAKGLR